MPNDDEMFAVVTNMLGGGRVRLRCNDGKERMGRIPGRMRFRTWINEDDVVLIEPWDWQDEKADVEWWDWQDEKADVEWRYDSQDAQQLREEGHID